MERPWTIEKTCPACRERFPVLLQRVFNLRRPYWCLHCGTTSQVGATGLMLFTVSNLMAGSLALKTGFYLSLHLSGDGVALLPVLLFAMLTAYAAMVILIFRIVPLRIQTLRMRGRSNGSLDAHPPIA